MKYVLFLAPLIAFASLDNTTQLTQKSPGIWEVSCRNLTVETRSTEDIRMNNICLVEKNQSHCVTVAKKSLPSRDYDGQNEMNEIISMCNSGSEYTHICMTELAPKLKSTSTDERNEVLSLIDSCSPSFIGIKEYLKLIYAYPAFQRADDESKLQIAQSLSQSTSPSIPCFTSAVEYLKKSEFDEPDELVELIRACTQAQIEIESCLSEKRSKLKNVLLYDQRSEVIELVSECNQL